VIEGTGGMKSLDEDDRANIRQTIDDEILKRVEISFRSTEVQQSDGRLAVRGELTLVGATRPITFDLALGDDHVSGSAVVTQTEWGMKPYSALFGALKVADEVRVEIDARLQSR
jgi:polyisoprenoid-binding protein YceI